MQRSLIHSARHADAYTASSQYCSILLFPSFTDCTLREWLTRGPKSDGLAACTHVTYANQNLEHYAPAIPRRLCGHPRPCKSCQEPPACKQQQAYTGIA